MKRFLRYALENGKKLRIVYMWEGRARQSTVTILSYDEDNFTFQQGRGKAQTLPLRDLLACDYARGDKGGGE